MLIVLAHNTTGTKPDGTSDYDVEIRKKNRQARSEETYQEFRSSAFTQTDCRQV